jgi:putative acetyltransferase
VVVLGHPAYYSRFGFGQASKLGVRCKWNVPAEAFMVLALDEDAMRDASGMARYRDEWDAAT